MIDNPAVRDAAENTAVEEEVFTPPRGGGGGPSGP